MFEITYTEVALLVWAVIATSKWMQYKGATKEVLQMLRTFVEDPKAREAMVASYEQLKKTIVKN